MKHFKRLVALVLVVTLMIGGAMSASAAKSFAYFRDVERSDWFYADVMQMVRCGYFQGMGNGNYQPDASVTRAMFVTVLGRITNLQTEFYDRPSAFTDVEADKWYTPYVNWAYSRRITTGTSRTTFSPHKAITREEMAVLISRCCYVLNITPAGLSEIPSAFNDETRASDWARDGIRMMRSTGIIRGDENRNFAPKQSATRAEATAIFSRFMTAARLRKKDSGKFFPETTVIAHAGGVIDGRAGSNTIESLAATYATGVDIIEIDFNFTSDGELACIHDWSSRFSPDLPENKAVTLEEFLQCRIYGKYTPTWLGNLCEFLEQTPGLYIVTDVKDNNIAAARKIKEQQPKLMDRFIIQVYSRAEYNAIRDMGFQQIIFSLYKMTWAEKTNAAALVRFAEEHKILGYTVSTEIYHVPGLISGLKKAGVPIFLHTVNEPAEQAYYFKNGIYAVYTDTLTK